MSGNIASITSGCITSVIAIIQNPDGGLLRVVIYGFVGGAVGYAGKILLQFIVKKIAGLLERRKKRKTNKVLIEK